MRREIFAKHLRQLIKDAGIRQTDLAFALGVSSAAISQFTHGTAMPSPQQLDKILLVLRTAPHIAEKIKYQLLLARSEPKKNKPEKVDLSDELDNNCRWPFMLDQYSVADYYSLCDNNDEGLADFVGVSENNKVGAPIIYLEDLLHYDPETPLAHFAQEYMRDMIVRDFEPYEDPAIILTSGSNLGMSNFTNIQLVIIQTLPEDVTSLELCLSNTGNFWLLPHEKQMSKWHVFCDKAPEKRENMLWSLPVLEVTMIPLAFKK